MAGNPIAPPSIDDREPFFSRLLPAVSIYWLCVTLLCLVATLPGATDLIGPDNDDSMRLVEVRDFLAGQGWFDLMQHRLGLAGGTLMHWSRFIDLPIATLIRFFSLFLDRSAAEGAAAVTWPLILGWFLLLPLGLAGRRLGGTSVMHIALGLGAIFIFTCLKFRPGALDHHNVQLVLTMWIAAMLVDPERRAWSYVVAGIAAALAIAVGAETMPFVAVACICVAVQWAWIGQKFDRAARAFGLSLALAVSAAFVATVPPSSYAVVTCDNLSFGFYSLSSLGGAGLFLVTGFSGLKSRLLRFLVLGGVGVLLAVAAVVIAPECLGDPLGNLDPLLVEFWLRGVIEARSIFGELKYAPEMVGGFYAAGVFSLLVCLWRIFRGNRPGLYLILFALIAAAWGVALIQIRGAFFANLLSILPLSLLIADLRQAMRSDPKSTKAALAYVVAVLAAVPAVWGVGGMVAKDGFGGLDLNALSTSGAEAGECGGPESMALLNTLPPGVIAAPSNSGADLLRFTAHRALSAPYHRNQGGMLTELHISLAEPDEAEAFLRGAGVTVLAFCRTDPQALTIMHAKPDGLYAALAHGKVPPFLKPMTEKPVDGFMLYRFVPETAPAPAG